MEIETAVIPTISTAHITASVAATLTELGNDNAWVTCASWTYGFFLRFHTLEDAPRCLIDIANWLTAHHFDDRWIRLDCDGEIVDDLPAYDW